MIAPVGWDHVEAQEQDVVVGGVGVGRELDGDGRVHFGHRNEVKEVLQLASWMLLEQEGHVVEQGICRKGPNAEPLVNSSIQ